MSHIIRASTTLALSLLIALAMVLPSGSAQATDGTKRAQDRLNALHCDAGSVDGVMGSHTRSAVVRFQSRHGLVQDGQLGPVTRGKLYSDDAKRCDRRPKPRHSGTGRRIVFSQAQNWIWIIGPRGGIKAQGGMIDNSSELSRGTYRHGSYCGRAAKIRRNTTATGDVMMDNFVRFAPCGFGFHRIPTDPDSGNQIHADWLLGTNYRASHGCIRVSRAMSFKIWDFVRSGTIVRVV